MIVPGRAQSLRRNRQSSASQVLLGALLILSVVASAFMTFTDSVQWLRIGLVSALWAATVGAFAMTKYRREAAAGAAKSRDLKVVYELQLEREISARREHELLVEHQVRQQVRAESSDELAELREELAALRQSLEILFDGDLHVERLALRVQSRRVQELGGRPPAGLSPPQSPQLLGGYGFAGPNDEPVTAEVPIVSEEADVGEVDAEHEETAPIGAHAAGRSVADLIASMGGGSTSGDAPRRRRRRED